MYRRAQWNVLKRQRVARDDIRLRARDDLLAHLQSQWRQDIPLLAVGVVQQRNVRRPIGVVFYSSDLGRYSALVPLEIDDPVFTPGAATAPANGNMPVAIPSRNPTFEFQLLLDGIGGSLYQRRVTQ